MYKYYAFYIKKPIQLQKEFHIPKGTKTQIYDELYALLYDDIQNNSKKALYYANIVNRYLPNDFYYIDTYCRTASIFSYLQTTNNFGIDSSYEMIEHAKKKYPTKIFYNKEVSTIHKIYSSIYVDGIGCFTTLLFSYKHWEWVIQQFCKKIKKTGYIFICIVDTNTLYPEYKKLQYNNTTIYYEKIFTKNTSNYLQKETFTIDKNIYTYIIPLYTPTICNFELFCKKNSIDIIQKIQYPKPSYYKEYVYVLQPKVLQER